MSVSDKREVSEEPVASLFNESAVLEKSVEGGTFGVVGATPSSAVPNLRDFVGLLLSGSMGYEWRSRGQSWDQLRKGGARG